MRSFHATPEDGEESNGEELKCASLGFTRAQVMGMEEFYFIIYPVSYRSFVASMEIADTFTIPIVWQNFSIPITKLQLRITESKLLQGKSFLEIAFENVVDENIVPRAWEGLIRNRINLLPVSARGLLV
ncbi:hypothetical protein BUALT_Bualt03G0110000 [Buddleja alternifolia]|uniref:Uncharacterized protein n=1 Tax=Buddleja alternifolia TaxID=168488 RepID=A0AAV6Y3K6_9LAMI|nr:hypothetical protein BUALT_Bualt03G0110000 [Buddleja alternifolia]